MAQNKSVKTSLVAGTIAALAASACCLGPLLLVSIGVSGAWISNLTLLEPFRPLFIGIALMFMILAYRRIYKDPAPQECALGSVCAIPETNGFYRILFWAVSLLVAVALAYPYLFTRFA